MEFGKANEGWCLPSSLILFSFQNWTRQNLFLVFMGLHLFTVTLVVFKFNKAKKYLDTCNWQYIYFVSHNMKQFCFSGCSVGSLATFFKPSFSICFLIEVFLVDNNCNSFMILQNIDFHLSSTHSICECRRRLRR